MWGDGKVEGERIADTEERRDMRGKGRSGHTEEKMPI